MRHAKYKECHERASHIGRRYNLTSLGLASSCSSLCEPWITLQATPAEAIFYSVLFSGFGVFLSGSWNSQSLDHRCARAHNFNQSPTFSAPTFRYPSPSLSTLCGSSGRRRNGFRLPRLTCTQVDTPLWKSKRAKRHSTTTRRSLLSASCSMLSRSLQCHVVMLLHMLNRKCTSRS